MAQLAQMEPGRPMVQVLEPTEPEQPTEQVQELERPMVLVQALELEPTELVQQGQEQVNKQLNISK